MKSASTAGATVSDKFKSVARACEPLKNRAQIMVWCKGSSTVTSTAVLLALLADWNHFENHCEAPTLENY